MDRPALPPIPLEADERTMLVAFLDHYRSALVDRAHGLTRDQMNALHPPSTLTLVRLIGHMALVEADWFQWRFDGEDHSEPFASLDWATDADAEMTLAVSWSVEELFGRFHAVVADANRRIAAAGSLDKLSVRPNRDGEHFSLRWILVHMIEEYARHVGHADLIRESIDGDVAS